MRALECVSCRTLAGTITPPGGIVGETTHWTLFLRARPALVAGQGFLVLRRHCEDVVALTPSEAADLGVAMQRTARAFAQTIAPERLHFGLYGEGVRHLHFHVLPRVHGLPAGNIPLTALGQWYEILMRLGLRRAAPDAALTELASRLRAAFATSA